MTRRHSSLTTCLLVALMLAPSQGCKPTGAKAEASGPSLAATGEWLTTTLPTLVGSSAAADYQPILTGVTFSNCIFSFTDGYEARGVVSDTTRYIVPLARVDTSEIRVVPQEPDSPTRYEVTLRALGGRRDFTMVVGERRYPAVGASFAIESSASGNRAVKALRHAAALCGATGGPF